MIRYFSLLVLLCCTLPQTLKAQEPAAAPVLVDKITGLITYEAVVEVKDASAETLYKRIEDWFKTYYKNPTDVIRENDAAKFKIVGKHRFKITNPPDKNGVSGDAGLVQYTITVSAREGRYKYVISEYGWKQLSVYPCERWMDEKAAGYQPVYKEYLSQLDKFTASLVSSLKEAAGKEKPVKNTDDW